MSMEWTCLPAKDLLDSPAYSPDLDYQDVKLKIVQQEGYDAHDFNLFDDRSSQLWRKPYVDGAVRELTSGDSRSQEQMRQAIEQMMLASGTTNPDVRHTSRKAHRARGRVNLEVDIDREQDLLTDIGVDQVPPRPAHITSSRAGAKPDRARVVCSNPVHLTRGARRKAGHDPRQELVPAAGITTRPRGTTTAGSLAAPDPRQPTSRVPGVPAFSCPVRVWLYAN
jgi:hypothetical protein